MSSVYNVIFEIFKNTLFGPIVSNGWRFLLPGHYCCLKCVQGSYTRNTMSYRMKITVARPVYRTELSILCLIYSRVIIHIAYHYLSWPRLKWNHTRFGEGCPIILWVTMDLQVHDRGQQMPRSGNWEVKNPSHLLTISIKKNFCFRRCSNAL